MEPGGAGGDPKRDPAKKEPLGFLSEVCVRERSEPELFRSSEAANFGLACTDCGWDHGQRPEGTREIGHIP
jgi:hypothetical protein